MIRILIHAVILLPVIAFCGLYLAYGEVYPCKALAVEQARRSTLPTAIAGIWTDTDDMTQTQCTVGLFDSWRERLTD